MAQHAQTGENVISDEPKDEIIQVGSKHYTVVRFKDDEIPVCNGCAAEFDITLCALLPECYRLHFKEVEEK